MRKTIIAILALMALTSCSLDGSIVRLNQRSSESTDEVCVMVCYDDPLTPEEECLSPCTRRASNDHQDIYPVQAR
jgi:hypothetical protein